VDARHAVSFKDWSSVKDGVVGWVEGGNDTFFDWSIKEEERRATCGNRA